MVTLPSLQVSRLSSIDLDVVTVYRSSNCPDAFGSIVNLLDLEKNTIICGDFNICYLENQNHPLIKSLIGLGFEQKVMKVSWGINDNYILYVLF